MSTPTAAALSKLRDNVGLAYRGEPRAVDLLLTALLSRGHLLIEDVPGVGKTTLARALARSLDADFRRIQFTSDLLPGDVIGISVFRSSGSDRFEFQPGPALRQRRARRRDQPRHAEDAVGAARGDERGRGHDRAARAALSRSPSSSSRRRTRSSTTAPTRCPESQLDRFLLRLSLGYPAEEEEKMLLRRGGTERVLAAIPAGALARAGPRAPGRAPRRSRSPTACSTTSTALVRATRQTAELRLPVSTRGAQALYRAAQAHALLHGRNYATPDDVHAIAEAVLAHRILSVSSDGFGAGGPGERDREEDPGAGPGAGMKNLLSHP